MSSKNNKHDFKFHANVTVYFILRILVLAVMVIQFIHGNYNNVFICLLTLILFLIPVIADHNLNIKLPTTLEIIILLFIFSAEILGEIHSFYVRIPYWDTILHIINGFMMAAIGFTMIDILNQHPKFHISMSPVFVAFTAFCFSMTIGVVWEFFEFAMDQLFLTDMQKDTLIPAISSVYLNPEGINDAVVVKDITETVIKTASGEITVPGGYLDVGVIDTMKDLLVNCAGALIFSAIGAVYIKNRGRGKFAARFIPQLKTPEEIRQSRQLRREFFEKKQAKKAKKRQRKGC